MRSKFPPPPFLIFKYLIVLHVALVQVFHFHFKYLISPPVRAIVSEEQRLNTESRATPAVRNFFVISSLA